jgi:hypothetical protein
MTTNIDVCCRDPNYTDPWPMDNGDDGSFGGNSGNGGKFTGNGGNSVGIAPRVGGQDSSQVVRKGSGYGK